MSEHWRASYDAWKTREPDEDAGPVCDKCGDWLRRDHTLKGEYWYCERCDEEPPHDEAQQRNDALRKGW